MTTRTTTVSQARTRGYGVFYLRAFVSLVMIASLAMFTITGLALFIAPSGQMAQTIGWSLVGLSKGQWETLHVAFGFLWVPLAVLHLWFNWRVVKGYLRDRTRRTFVWRRELAAALGVTALLAVAAVFDLPPVTQLMALEESFTDVWARRADTIVALPGANASPLGGFAGGPAGGLGGGVGRYATIDPESGTVLPVGKEAAARTVAEAPEASD